MVLNLLIRGQSLLVVSSEKGISISKGLSFACEGPFPFSSYSAGNLIPLTGRLQLKEVEQQPQQDTGFRGP